MDRTVQNSEANKGDKIETPQDEDLASQYLDHLQRLQAEFSNYKKRIEREKLELSHSIKSELIGNLLPVIDDFERFLFNHKGKEDSVVQGIRLIYHKLMTTLKEEGLEPIESKGCDFDPNIHEAVLIGVGQDGDDGKILEEWQGGYQFNGKLLRPAKVKVGRSESKVSKPRI